jgi:ribosomal-protein-alanine N-acetyltransferase
MSPRYEIETTRLRLRVFNLADLDELALIFSDPEVMKYIGTEGKPMSRDETEKALDVFVSDWEKYGFSRWAVCLKESGRLIGCCGLKLLEGTPEVIYVLARDYWGRGYGSEAAKTSLRYGFECLGLDQIVAVTRHENVRSQRVMSRIGMRYEKEILHYAVEGVGYVITKKEFEPDDSIYLLRKLDEG